MMEYPCSFHTPMRLLLAQALRPPQSTLSCGEQGARSAASVSYLLAYCAVCRVTLLASAASTTPECVGGGDTLRVPSPNQEVEDVSVVRGRTSPLLRASGRVTPATDPLQHYQSSGQRTRVRRVDGRGAARRWLRDQDLSQGPRASQPARAAGRPWRGATAALVRPRGCRDRGGPELAAPAILRGEHRRLGLGPGRIRHEGRRRDDDLGLLEGEGRGAYAAGGCLAPHPE